MPQIKPRREIEFDDEIEEDIEEPEGVEEEEIDSIDSIEEEPKPVPAKKGRGRPTKQESIPEQPKRRYLIAAPQPLRIVDAEGNEVIAEGDYLVPQALTDIIERLERIEDMIGNITER